MIEKVGFLSSLPLKTAADLLYEHGIKLINWEYTPAIENRFSRFTLSF